MQYILNQEEFNEYLKLKKLYTQNPYISYAKQKVYDCFKNNPGITYEEASSIIGTSAPSIHKHIVQLEQMGYVRRDKKGKVCLIEYTS